MLNREVPVSQIFQLGHASIHCLSQQAALEAILSLAEAPRSSFVVTPNSDHIVMLEEQADLRAAYAKAELVLADGMPLVWASRLIGPPLPARVTGAELLPLLCREAAKRGLRVFLLGAGPGVALRARDNLVASYPGLLVCGTYSPPFGFEQDPRENQNIWELITGARAQLIFVGLGAPKQELWIAEHKHHFSTGVFLGVGAAIDFCAGQVRRAPAWMQSLGLEWAFRLCQEPKRLAARYLRDTKILWIIWRQWRKKAGF